MARLFLTSAGVRGRVDALTELVGAGAGVAVSANALDEVDPAERDRWLDLELSTLAGAGLDPFEVDLRRETVEGADMFWATGGNAFVLRRALAASGMDALLRERVASDTLAWGGSSAGSCVCGPTLRGIELIDDAGESPIFDGLGLVDYSIVPHAGTDAMTPFVDYLRGNGLPYRELRDGEAIVVHGARETMIGCHGATRD